MRQYDVQNLVILQVFWSRHDRVALCAVCFSMLNTIPSLALNKACNASFAITRSMTVLRSTVHRLRHHRVDRSSRPATSLQQLQYKVLFHNPSAWILRRQRSAMRLLRSLPNHLPLTATSSTSHTPPSVPEPDQPDRLRKVQRLLEGDGPDGIRPATVTSTPRLLDPLKKTTQVSAQSRAAREGACEGLRTTA